MFHVRVTRGPHGRRASVGGVQSQRATDARSSVHVCGVNWLGRQSVVSNHAGDDWSYSRGSTSTSHGESRSALASSSVWKRTSIVSSPSGRGSPDTTSHSNMMLMYCVTSPLG